MADDTYKPEQRVEDAVCAIVAMTAKQVADRAGVPLKVAQKVLKRMVDQGSIEQRGQRYRIENASQWVEARDDIPPVGVPCSITFDASPKGYKVTLTPRMARPEPPAAPEEPPVEHPAPPPEPEPVGTQKISEGQIQLFAKYA